MKALDNRRAAESIVLRRVLCCFRDVDSAAQEDQSLETKIDQINEIKLFLQVRDKDVYQHD